MRRLATVNNAALRAVTLFLATVAVACASASSADAGKDQRSIFNDPTLFAAPEKWANELDDLKSLGVEDYFQIVTWRSIAPDPTATQPPQAITRTKRGSPEQYPAASWLPLDSFLRALESRGIDPILNLSGPAPIWANRNGQKPKRSFSSVEPNPGLFQRFVEAVGKRYPRVKRWACWNEPNLESWLSPQFKAGDDPKRPIPWSPVMYRRLLLACERGLELSGHGRDAILLGETSPRAPSGNVAPIDFIREVLCLDESGVPYSGSRAAVRRCPRVFKPLPARVYGHHPHLLGQTPFSQPTGEQPGWTDASRWIPMGAIDRLVSVLDQGASFGRIHPGMPIYLTEFGIESNPPDAINGVPMVEQARLLNISEHIAYRHKRVLAYSQYGDCDQWGTEASNGTLTGYQTGIKDVACRPKPAYDAYRLPISVGRKGNRAVKFWGHVRPLARLGAKRKQLRKVQVETSTDGASFVPFGSPLGVDNRRGYFDFVLRKPDASDIYWRAAWTDRAGKTHYSRTAKPQTYH